MSVQTTSGAQSGGHYSAPTLDDRSGRRLAWAICVSLVLNLLLWISASGIMKRQKYHDYKLVEMARYVVPNKVHMKPLPKARIKRPAEQHKSKPTQVAHITPRLQQSQPKPPPERS